MKGNFQIGTCFNMILAKDFRAILPRVISPLLVLLLFLASPLRSVSGTLPMNNFTVSGVVDGQYFSGGSLITRSTYQFTCHVSGDRYSILLTLPSPAEDRTSSFECVFDGTNTYSTTRFSTNPVTAITHIKNGQLITQDLKNPVAPNNDAVLEIKSGFIPPSDNHAVMLLWLGFASATEYATAGSPLFQEPLMYLGSVYEHQHIKLKTAFKMHDLPPGFLEWREDYHEGKMFYEEKGILKQRRLQGKLASGYTNSIFTVSDWIKVSRFAFPKHMQLDLFIPRTSGDKLERRVICSADVVSVSTITNVEEASFRPEVRPKTTIADRRKAITGSDTTQYYLSQNGQILGSEDLGKNRRYKMPLQPPPRIAHSWSHSAYLCLFALVFTAPIFLMAFILRRKKLAAKI